MATAKYLYRETKTISDQRLCPIRSKTRHKENISARRSNTPREAEHCAASALYVRGVPWKRGSQVCRQLDAWGKGGPAGFGLGLAYCRLAVEGHGGEVAVESRSGEGTTFTLLLPAAPGREK